jgi:hypothetical protein
MDTTHNLGSLTSFRIAIDASFTLWADALFELIDALLPLPATQSPVELSQSSALRRKSAGVHDALRHGKLNRDAIRKTWHDSEPAEAITVGGYTGSSGTSRRDDSSSAQAKAIPNQSLQDSFLPLLCSS